MKKFFSLAVLTLLVCSYAIADNEQLISFEQLPQKAQNFVKTYFANDNISYLTMEREGLGVEYDVKFVSGSSVEFLNDGSLKKVDCAMSAVPAGIVPEAVVKYVSQMYPNAIITEWGMDDFLWKAELNNGLELMFNRQYQPVGIDD